jgi:hypothetical protein
VISPENGFSLYFLGYLQHLREGRISDSLRQRLHMRLETSPFWRDRFAAFGLSEHDLATGRFPEDGQQPMRLVSGAGAHVLGP